LLRIDLLWLLKARRDPRGQAMLSINSTRTIMVSSTRLLLLLLLLLKGVDAFAPLSFYAMTRTTTLLLATSTSSPSSNVNVTSSCCSGQDPNEDAPVYDFDYENGQGDSKFESMTELNEETLQNHKDLIDHDHFETRSLDDLFPGIRFSETFNSCAVFRNGLLDAIRYDMISDANAGAKPSQPAIYGQMTNKQREQELARNAPLIGYWKSDDDPDTIRNTVRMKNTTAILRQYLGSSAPTGDALFEAIGSLCNSTQTPHEWTEVVGVGATQNFQMGDKSEHAWHQDYGHLQTLTNEQDPPVYQSHKHVFFAFPYEDQYVGTGVLPHLVQLKHQQWARPKDHSRKSIFYQGTVPDQYIVRPRYVPGSAEIIMFRDVDVLHSSPDIQYRTSIMRFG
jgi:hypothetical protein